MRPFHAAAIGAVLVVVDFRTTSLDLLPDVIGWALLAYALHRLRPGWPVALAVAGGALSLSTLVLPYHWIELDPFTGERVVVDGSTDLGYAKLLEYDHLSGARLGLAAGATALFAVVAWLLADVVAGRAAQRGGHESARHLRTAAVGVALAWAAPRLVGMAAGAAAGGYDPVWNDHAARIGLVGIVAGLVLAVVFAREAREPWALRPGSERLLRSSTP